jgi:LysR family hydrogen peroxide-inducible transcriptional activator
MVAAGIGITVMPRTSVPKEERNNKLLRYIPFDRPIPDRRIVLAWRKSFPRAPAIDALAQAVYACALQDVKMLPQQLQVQTQAT